MCHRNSVIYLFRDCNIPIALIDKKLWFPFIKSWPLSDQFGPTTRQSR